MVATAVLKIMTFTSMKWCYCLWFQVSVFSLSGVSTDHFTTGEEMPGNKGLLEDLGVLLFISLGETMFFV